MAAGGLLVETGCAMDKKLGLIVLAVSSPLALVCAFIEADWAVAVFAGTVIVHPLALIGLGAASRRGSLGPLRPYLGALAVWLSTVMLLLLQPPAQLAGRTLFGVPWNAVLMLAGLWIVPMGWTTLAYVKTFSSLGLRDRDLTRIRRDPTSPR